MSETLLKIENLTKSFGSLEGGRIAAEGTSAAIFDGRHDGRLGAFLGKVHVGAVNCFSEKHPKEKDL